MQFFRLQHFPLSVFEGSLARKFCFHIFNFQFFSSGKSRTKTPFSHCPCSAFKIVSHENFVFTSPTFSSSNYFRKRVSPAEKRVPRKTFFERTNRPAFGRRELWFFDYRLVIVRVIVWDTWLDQKNMQNNDSGKPLFSKLLKMSWTKFEAAVENKKHKPKGIQEKSGIKSTCCKASHCAFLSPAWRVVTSKSWGKKSTCGWLWLYSTWNLLSMQRKQRHKQTVTTHQCT